MWFFKKTSLVGVVTTLALGYGCKSSSSNNAESPVEMPSNNSNEDKEEDLSAYGTLEKPLLWLRTPSVVTEGETVHVVLKVSNAVQEALEVVLYTRGISANPLEDFEDKGRFTVQINPGETDKTVSFSTLDDNVAEGLESFEVVLHSTTKGSVIPAMSKVIALIKDNADNALDVGGSVDVLQGSEALDVKLSSEYTFTQCSPTSTLGMQVQFSQEEQKVTYVVNNSISYLGEGARLKDMFFCMCYKEDPSKTESCANNIWVVGVNDAPQAVNDEAQALDKGDDLEIPVLSNDTDLDDSDTLRIVALDKNSYYEASIVIDEDVVRYVPTSDFLSALGQDETLTDTFSYTVMDAFGAEDVGSVEIEVTGVNDAPAARNDAVEITLSDENTVSVYVLGNDTDVDVNDILHVFSVSSSSAKGCPVVLEAGVVRYGVKTCVPTVEGEYTTDSFTYVVSDGDTQSNEATVEVKIYATDEGIEAVDDACATNEDTSAVCDVLANDADSRGSLTHVVSVDALSSMGALVVLNTLGEVEYHPEGVLDALIKEAVVEDTFEYTVANERGGEDTAEVTVSVTGVNDAPVLLPDVCAFSASQAPYSCNVLQNDTDPEGQVGSVLSFQVNTTDKNTSLSVASSNAVIAYNPSWALLGAGDVQEESFSYRLTDSEGGFAETTVTVQVTGVDDLPVAVADVTDAWDADGEVHVIDVLSNDYDPENGTFFLCHVDESSDEGVSISVTNDNMLEYSTEHWLFLRDGVNQEDTFMYGLCLSSEDTTPVVNGQVTVHVRGTNKLPVGVSDSYSLTGGASANLLVLANDTDTNTSDVLSVHSCNATSHLGVPLSCASGTDVVYNGTTSFGTLYQTQTAEDYFDYWVKDNVTGSQPVQVRVSLTVVGTQVCAYSLDACGACVDPNDTELWNGSCKDCSGVPNGEATLDSCGNCWGGTTGVEEDTSCVAYTCDMDEWVLEPGSCEPRCADVCDDTGCSESCFSEASCGLLELAEGETCCQWRYANKLIWAPSSKELMGDLNSVTLENCQETDTGACVWSCAYDGVVFSVSTIEVPKTTCWYEDDVWNTDSTSRVATCSSEHPCGFICNE